MEKFVNKNYDNSNNKILLFLIFFFAIFTIIATWGNGSNVTYAEGTTEFELGFICTDKTDSSITLSWAQYEGEGTYYYNLFKDDVLFSNTVENSYVVSGLQQDTYYKFKLQILDEANNVIQESLELNEKTAKRLTSINYNEENIATLTEDVYILNQYENLTIPEGKTLNVEAGTTIKVQATQKIIVNGNLFFYGTQEKKITVTSVSEKWDNIEISTTGNFEANNTILTNLGRAGWYNTEAIISNGSIKLNNIEISPITLSTQIVATGQRAELTNSKLIGGLILYDLKSCKIENNELNVGMSINNIENVEGIKNNVTIGNNYPITCKITNYNTNLFENIENNHNIENANYDGIYLGGTLVSNLNLASHNVYIVDGLVIPEGMTLEVEAGTTMKMKATKQITVNGNLLLKGTNDSRITLTSVTDRWSHIEVGATGNVEASYTTLLSLGRKVIKIQKQ